MNTEEINKNAKTLGRTTAKGQSGRVGQSYFACISLFRRFVYFSLIPATTPMEAHRTWLSQRIAYLNIRRSTPYVLSAHYPDADDEPMALEERRNMYCSTSNIREFYLHTFIGYSPSEVSGLYSVNLCAEGGIYSTQIAADSLEGALSVLKDAKLHIFDEHLSTPKNYYALLEEAGTCRLLHDVFPNLWISSAYLNGNTLEPSNTSIRGKERVFSQEEYTLFVVPTL